MSFTFGFSGDDIEDEDDEVMQDAPVESSANALDEGYPSKGKRAKKEDISELLMAESDGDDDYKSLKQLDAGLGGSDIEQDVYEGGFKSWEGAMDLAQLLLDLTAGDETEALGQTSYVVELGCGTAIPSLILFQHALSANVPLHLTLADYNSSVLRLVTLPNLLLAWALRHSPASFSPSPPSIDTSLEPHSIQDPTGDLEITPELLDAFTSDLARRQILLTLVSGPWSASEDFTSLLALPPRGSPALILAAETVYSPGALRSFAAALLAALRLVDHGMALVAAKRMYFGVGGGVEEFKERMVQDGGRVAEVQDSGIAGCDGKLLQAAGGGGGVGRWIGRVWVD